MLALALICALLVGPALQQKEVWRETHPDGSPRLEVEVTRGRDGARIREGQATEWHPNGQVAAKGRYSKDQKVGPWEGWHAGGERAWRGRFERGARKGKWSFWHADGVEDLQRSGEYVFEQLDALDGAQGGVRARGYRIDGRRHGVWRFYWPDGRLQASGLLSNGQRHGQWVFHHEDGTKARALVSGVYDSGSFVRPLEPDELEAWQPPAEDGLEVTPRSAGDCEPAAPPAGAWHKLVLDLQAADLAAAEDVALFPREGPVPPELATLGCKQGFGWSAELTPAGLEVRREAVRCVRSLWALTHADPVFWTLDAFDGGDALVRAPPFLPEDRAGYSQRGRSNPFYAARFTRAGGDSPGKGAPAAVSAGLRWLALHQLEDGGWDSQRFVDATQAGAPCGCDGPGQEGWRVGATALALLPFLGDGHTPYSGEHRAVVARGVGFLLRRQDKSGLFASRWTQDKVYYQQSLFIYEHLLATLVLAEVQALGSHPALAGPLERAVKQVLAARNPHAAWKYALPPDGDNDTSVTGWAVQALRAAEEAGIAVEREPYEGALSWLELMTDPGSGRSGYNGMGGLSARVPRVNDHFPADMAETMTAVALFTRFLAGQVPQKEPILALQAKLILTGLPRWDVAARGCDMYSWFYASHALAQMGGDAWRMWAKALGEAAVGAQRADGHFVGSWDPIDPWGMIGGRLYATAMLTLALESPYRIGRMVPEERRGR